jgi:hypothetical protein
VALQVRLCPALRVPPLVLPPVALQAPPPLVLPILLPLVLPPAAHLPLQAPPTVVLQVLLRPARRVPPLVALQVPPQIPPTRRRLRPPVRASSPLSPHAWPAALAQPFATARVQRLPLHWRQPWTTSR